MKKILLIIFILGFVLNIYGKWLVYKDTNGIDSKYLDAYKNIKLSNEKFYIYKPKTKYNNEKLSLWSFIYAGDKFEIPSDWEKFCDKNNIIILAAQKVGNKQSTNRRVGVTLLGTLKTIYEEKIDPKRVFIFGYSGGGRVAAMATFYHNEIFKGCLGICGIQFNIKIDFPNCEKPGEYGYFEYNGSDVNEIKKNNLFVIITGSKDFRYCYLKDIYQYGFKKNGFKAKLLDYKNFEHTLCNSSQLEEVLVFFNKNLK